MSRARDNTAPIHPGQPTDQHQHGSPSAHTSQHGPSASTLSTQSPTCHPPTMPSSQAPAIHPSPTSHPPTMPSPHAPAIQPTLGTPGYSPPHQRLSPPTPPTQTPNGHPLPSHHTYHPFTVNKASLASLHATMGNQPRCHRLNNQLWLCLYPVLSICMLF